jgi:hypothetical protein
VRSDAGARAFVLVVLLAFFLAFFLAFLAIDPLSLVRTEWNRETLRAPRRCSASDSNLFAKNESESRKSAPPKP